jgi:acetylornithine deacetylase/succinyl-diaminopimelate desuccinylase-like protein
VARLVGTDQDAPSLAYVTRTDVVPASPEGWDRDPFAGDYVDGYIWGRGAIDMLNLTSSMAVVFRRLAIGGFRPRGTLTFVAAADEEAGGPRGAGWLLQHRPDIAMAYVVTETGSPPVAGPPRVLGCPSRSSRREWHGAGSRSAGPRELLQAIPHR